MAEERKIFDNSETEMVFGSVIVNYKNVQDKIINKYNQQHKEIINKFAFNFG